MSAKVDLNKDEENTICSEDRSEVTPVSTSGSKKRRTLWMALIAVIIAAGVAAGVLLSIDKKESPIQLQEPTSFEDELTETYSPAAAMDFFVSADGTSNVLGYVNSDTGCVHAITNDEDQDVEPLCNDYVGEIDSLFIRSGEMAIAHGGAVEIFSAQFVDGDKLTWSPLSDKSNVVSIEDAPGFGKKVYKTGRNLFVQADNALYHFVLEEETDFWYETNVWEGPFNFDVDSNEEFVAIYEQHPVTSIYDENKIAVYSLDSDFWWSTRPTVHVYQHEIGSIVVAANGHVHLVTAVGSDKTVKIKSFTSKRAMSFPNYRLVGDDMLHSLDSGSIYNVRSGEFLGVQIEADEVLDIEVAGETVAILVERGGVRTVNVYNHI